MNYVIKSWHRFSREKTIGSINILGWAMGMAAAVMILLWVRNEYSYDRYHPNSQRIYFVNWSSKDGVQKWDGSPALLADAARQEIPGIEKTTRYQPIVGNGISSVTIEHRHFIEHQIVYVDRDWFDFFHYNFLQGDQAVINRSVYGAVLTESMAKKYFGTVQCLGKIIQVDTVSYQVSAVTRDNPFNTSFPFNIFLCLNDHPDSAHPANAWNLFFTKTFVRLSPSTTPDKVRAAMESLFVRKGSDTQSSLSLLPLKEVHFGSNIISPEINYGNKTVVWVLLLIGILLLSTACINYVNLTTARASRRIKEISIKKIIGADRKDLFMQLMSEAIFTGLVALLFTILFIALCLPYFNAFTGKHFSLWEDASSVWELLACTSILSIVLTGIYPALLLSSFSPKNLLKGVQLFSPRNSRLRKVLVVSQFTIAIALIIATLIIFKQLHFIEDQQEGYDRSQIFSLSLPRVRKPPPGFDQVANMNTFKQELLRKPGIDEATIMTGSILNINMSMTGAASWDNKDPNFNPSTYLFAVDSDFRKVFPLDVKEGRWFQSGYMRDKHNYILNETAVRELKLQAPFIGQRFALASDTGEIVGIVKDFHFRSYHEKIAPLILAYDAPWKNTLYVKTRVKDMNTILKETRLAWAQFYPDHAFDYTLLDEAFEQLYQSEIKTSDLIGVFAGIAIVISCLGLFGLAAFSGEQRIKEIGIRKVMGASVTQIATLLSKDFIFLVFLSILIASPIAWWAMHAWLNGYAYHIAINGWIFVLAGGAALLIALLSISYQAIKSGLANPIHSLRYD